MLESRLARNKTNLCRTVNPAAVARSVEGQRIMRSQRSVKAGTACLRADERIRDFPGNLKMPGGRWRSGVIARRLQPNGLALPHRTDHWPRTQARKARIHLDSWYRTQPIGQRQFHCRRRIAFRWPRGNQFSGRSEPNLVSGQSRPALLEWGAFRNLGIGIGNPRRGRLERLQTFCPSEILMRGKPQSEMPGWKCWCARNTQRGPEFTHCSSGRNSPFAHGS